MPLHLVLLGPPASGKGTQGKRLAEREELSYLSTGSLLREAASEPGDLAREIAPVLARGGYVEDGLMCRITEAWLDRHADGWVLDGFPRTLPQDAFLADWVGARDRRIDAAISLEVPKDGLVARIENRVECPACRWTGQAGALGAGGRCPACGAAAGRRADDTLENFLRRYDEFATHTRPVIERYAAEGMLLTCDADQEIDRVTAEIEKSVNRIRNHGQTA